MHLREVLKDAAKNAGAAILGSTLGGAVIVFLNGFQPMDHGRDQSFTIEAALAGALFGMLAGTVYLAPLAAILGGLLSHFASRRAARIAAWSVGALVFILAVAMALVWYFRWFESKTEPAATPPPVQRRAVGD